MSLNLQIPKKSNLKPTITVLGVGGAGGNAVNNMIASNLEGVKFIVANTDAQSIDNALADNKIQLGETITQGLGAGSYPEVGKAAAEETADTIIDQIQDSNMVFITAGMGGGTGTGAAPVIARLAREQGILTVAVVTKPFHFEGSHRMRVAELGLQELQKYVDTLVVIPNQNLFRVADKSTTFADAFRMADEVLSSGIRGITDLMVMPGLINLDFADVRSVMSEMGKAMMGNGESGSEKRAAEAAEAAISNPLLDNISMKGARGVLINITGGPDLTLFEVDEAANRIREEVDPDANIIFGSTFDKNLEGRIRVSIVATGIDAVAQQESAGNVTSLFAAKAKAKQTGSEGEESEAKYSKQYDFGGSSGYQGDLGVEDEEQTQGFVAPDPVEPEIDNASEEDESAYRQPPVAERPFPTAKAKPRGLRLFGKTFGADAVEDAPPPAGETEQTETSYTAAAPEERDDNAASSARGKRKGQGEDFLDIPAFLRRKTN